jgi:hypothetical protein
MSPQAKAVNAQIAQSVEQGTENPRVGGSIPSLGTLRRHRKVPFFILFSSFIFHQFKIYNQIIFQNNHPKLDEILRICLGIYAMHPWE